MIRWPGQVEPGERDALATALDLAPTVLHAADLHVPGSMAGLNLRDLADGTRQRKTLYGEVFAHDAVDLDDPGSSLRYRWIRENQWKLIVPVDGPPELYNIEQDPEEENNVAEQHTSLIERLHLTLNAWWKP